MPSIKVSEQLRLEEEALRKLGSVQKKHPYIEFRNELINLLNAYNLENPSNTPDHLLADYLIDCLIAYNKVCDSKERLLNTAQKGEYDGSVDYR